MLSSRFANSHLAIGIRTIVDGRSGSMKPSESLESIVWATPNT